MMRVTARVFALILALLPALAAWMATAAVAPSFAVQAAVALVAFVAPAWLSLRWMDRGRPEALAGRARLAWVGGGAIVYALAAHLVVGRPPARWLEEPAVQPDLAYMRLSDGARLAFLRVSSAPGRDASKDTASADVEPKAPVL